MDVKALREQRNQLAQQFTDLLPKNGDGEVDYSGEQDITSEARAKAENLGHTIRLLDTQLQFEQSGEIVAAQKNALVNIAADKRNVSADEANHDRMAVRRAWSNSVFDRIANEYGVDERSTPEQKELMASARVKNIDTATSDAQGAAAVPSEVIGEMLVEMNNENVVRQVATVNQVSSGVTQSVPIADLVKYETGTGKPVAGAELGTPMAAPGAVPSHELFAKSQIEFQRSQVPAVPISLEFLQDSTIDSFASQLLTMLGEVMGSWELGLMSAHAAPAQNSTTKIRGYLVDANKGADAATADTVVAKDFQNLLGSIRGKFRRRSTLMIGRSLFGDVIGFTIGNIPAWVPGFPDGRGGAGQAFLFGVPFVENDVLGAKTANPGTPIASVGDMSRYRILDVAGALRTNVYNDSRYGENYAIGVQVFNRVGARLVTAQTGDQAPVRWLASK